MSLFGTSMGMRRRRTGHRRRRVMGHGFFGDLWSGIKDVGRNVGSVVANVAPGLIKEYGPQALALARQRLGFRRRRRLLTSGGMASYQGMRRRRVGARRKRGGVRVPMALQKLKMLANAGLMGYARRRRRRVGLARRRRLGGVRRSVGRLLKSVF